MSTTEHAVREEASKRGASLAYSSGFGNEHSSEALAGALPVGRNNPQRPPYGLYTELLSVTGFTELRPNTRRSWLYRIRPSVSHARFERFEHPTLLAPPFTDVAVEPNSLSWAPMAPPAPGTDFVAGLWTLGGNGDPAQRSGMAVHTYVADTSMTDRVFGDTDGELLIIPEQGGLLIHTEFGPLSVEPGSLALIPRAVKFRVEILGVVEGGNALGFVRGHVFENFGTPFTLPELGFMGQSGMSNPRDFLAPVAAYDDSERPVEVIHKVAGGLWHATYDHSPLDVVAWHGNAVPYVYDMHNFQVVGSVSFDHPDPSRYTALTSLTAVPGLGNLDFAIIPPEWSISEDTFRPPYYHRNVSAEIGCAIEAGGFSAVTGTVHLTNTLTPHGAPEQLWAAGSEFGSAPDHRDGLMVAVETQWPIALTRQAAEAAEYAGDVILPRHFRR